MGLTILLMVLFGGIIFRSTVESLESSWVDASLFARQSLLHGWLVSGWEQNMQRRAGGVKSLWAHFHPSQRPPSAVRRNVPTSDLPGHWRNSCHNISQKCTESPNGRSVSTLAFIRMADLCQHPNPRI